jgi:3-deoxy-D-manno-octulosonate 8-phosphate phosphatase (KDO 8-P phosphatase)
VFANQVAAFRNSVTPTILQKARRIRLAAFDVDGVMSDGTLAYADSESEIKLFHTLDGQGLKLLAPAGIALAIVSARQSAAVQRRADELGITRLIQGAKDKLASMIFFASELNISLTQCAFMGDDLADLQALQACGLACSVPAAPLIMQCNAHYVTRRSGGAGAVREFCDLLLRAQRAGRAP